MKVSCFLGNKTFEVREAELQQPKENEVIIKVGACGVCGTDVHIYHGEKGSAEVVPPVVLGHEFSGEVTAIGSGVQHFQVGDHVTVDPNIYCGKCEFCKTGKKQLCENLYAIGVNRDGGFAEYCTVPAAQCLKLEKTVPYEIGAMSEPVACCLHGIKRAQIQPGDTVCIIGGGAIGLIMVQLAKLVGAAAVIVSEPVEMRRQVASQIGADFTIDPIHENLLDRFYELTGKQGADVVIECVGRVEASHQAIELAGKGGHVLLFSVPKPGTEVALDLMSVYKKELTICGSFINPDIQYKAVELINSGRLDLAPIITNRYPLNQMEEAIKKQMSSDSLKVIVVPNMK